MKTVLIHYKKWVDAPHPMLDGDYVERSEVVEVLKLIDLNYMFENITKIQVLSE
jgi:hypothetical protein